MILVTVLYDKLHRLIGRKSFVHTATSLFGIKAISNNIPLRLEENRMEAIGPGALFSMFKIEN